MRRRNVGAPRKRRKGECGKAVELGVRARSGSAKEEWARTKEKNAILISLPPSIRWIVQLLHLPYCATHRLQVAQQRLDLGPVRGVNLVLDLLLGEPGKVDDALLLVRDGLAADHAHRHEENLARVGRAEEAEGMKEGNRQEREPKVEARERKERTTRRLKDRW